MTTLATRQPAALAADSKPADARAAAAYVGSLAPGSRPVTLSRLAAAARILWPELRDADTLAAVGYAPWSTLTAAHVAALASALAQQYAPSTANATLCATRGVLRSAWQLGAIDAEELARATHGGPAGRTVTIRGSSAPTGRHLEAGEIAALCRAAQSDDNRGRGLRDAALLAVLLGGGLRRAEASALTWGDYDAEAGTVTVRHGKGGKARVVPLASGTAPTLAAWRQWRENHGGADGPLLCGLERGGERVRGGMGPRAIGDALARLGQAANVGHVTAHDLRRTVAGELLDAGADLATVQKILGHASPTTTARYDRRPARARAKAARLRHLPLAA